jgi:Integrase core domain
MAHRADYNRLRPHSALGYLTPAAYAANLTATCDRLRNPDQLRRSHVAPPAPHGVIDKVLRVCLSVSHSGLAFQARPSRR